MNERIQELAYEAEDYADSIVDRGGEFHPAYTQKLAELIIQECALTIQDFVDHRIPASEYSNSLKLIFGVRE